MIGTRPLSDEEVLAISGHLGPRDRALFLLGVGTGFRISELLSLRVQNVEQGGKIVPSIYVARKHMKGKIEGRTTPLAARPATALAAWLALLRQDYPELRPDAFLFRSRKGRRSINRITAWHTIQVAAAKAGVQGRLGTHCMRKTFAVSLYELLHHDIFKLQRAMGHKSISGTARYIGYNIDDEVNAAILAAGR